MSFRHHPEVIAFKGAADSFCALLERQPTNAETWVESMLAATARLYASAQTLPKVSLDGEADVDPPGNVSHDEWRRVFEMVAAVLGGQRYYWAFFDPSEPRNSQKAESVCGDLADDLADIYRDIKPGLREWETGRDECLQRAVFDWRVASFDDHWGIHAVSAMRALHPIAFLRGLSHSDA